jgi:catechol 2,3-dioxygenase-like lactoylglutathione lyase family enzyme
LLELLRELSGGRRLPDLPDRAGREARRRMRWTIERELPERRALHSDTADLDALTAALTACDLVTCDAFMADVVRRARLDLQHRCELFTGRRRDVNRLRERLEQLVSPGDDLSLPDRSKALNPNPCPKEGEVTKTASRIGGISLVAIPATDQDRSIEFYVERLGFEKRTDVPFGGEYRWVEVYPPSGTTGIALAPPRPGSEPTPMETGITLTTDDIDATHAYLQGQGVDVDPEVYRMGDPVPPMFWFRDPDGHTLLIVEQA